jgi:thiamine-phosphate pyrophosphorylase
VNVPRFYPILDTETARQRGVAVDEVAKALIGAGARILQFRHKMFYSRHAFAALEKVAALCHRAGVTLVVNDRADLARLVGAALHLGQDDLPPAAARRVLGETGAIGFSTHNEAQLRAAAAEPVDYIALGPIFGTVSKENPDPVVGLAELRRLRAMATRPLVAIGGITRANALSVIEAGADSVAVIGDLFPAEGSIWARAEEWLKLVD